MSTNGPDSAAMMTLSAIAYQSDINGQLLNPNLATAGDWSLVWGPMADDYGNLAYVAISASTGRYALTIRGSKTTFSLATLQNWFNNLDVLVQVPWKYFSNIQGCMISNGALIQASDLTSASWSGQTLTKFLTQDIPEGATLMVTGHSLGGNLASVLASWISSLRGPPASEPDPNTVVYTFAAPTAGNTAFASAFNTRFPNSWRYWNSQDVVPYAWENLPDLDQIYDGIGIPAPGDIKVVIDGMETSLLASEAWYDSYYHQPNDQGDELVGHAVIPPNEWTLEAAIQHGSSMYLSLLGAPLILSELLSSRTDLERGPVLERPELQKKDMAPRFPLRRQLP
jgi:triacylglycerol lipase